MQKKQSIKILGYSPPYYSPTKYSIITYYVRDLHNANTSIRKQIRLDYIKDIKQRDKYAKELVKELTLKLKSGWHPDGVVRNSREVTMEIALEAYLDKKKKEFKDNQIRFDTIRSSKSMIGVFQKWLKREKYHQLAPENFTKGYASEYMDYIYMEKDVSSITYNNYLMYARMFFNDFIEKDWCAKNPFQHIKPKKSPNKSERVPLTLEERKKVKEYFLEKNPYYLLCILLIFHSGIRRTELTKIKVDDIDFENKVIVVKNTTAKTKRQRYASMPSEVIRFMLTLKINEAPSRYFLIGNEWMPGDSAISPKRLTKAWARARIKLKLHPKAQLYSVRKTGGIQKAEDKISVQALKDFFGHSDLKTAAHYLENHRNKGNDELKSNVSDF